MNRKFLYVSNYDPSSLLEYINEVTGKEFDTANNRYEAEQAVQRVNYAGVVMTDLALAPGVLEPGEEWDSLGPRKNAYQNGLRLARRIKQRGLPLIVLTSAEEEYLEELKALGVDEVFKKVVDHEKFHRAVREMCVD